MSLSSSSRPAATVLAALAIALAPAPAVAQTVAAAATVRATYREISSEVVAQQLGAKMSPNQPDVLSIGTSVTASLVDPARLAAFGIADARIGARVTFARTSVDRVLVEVDELDPVPRTRRVTLKMQPDGRLSVLGG